MVLDRVPEVAAARGIPRAQVALGWLLSKPVITAPIARNKPPAPSDRTHAVILPAHRELADAPLEGTRFELSVPRPRLPRVGAACPRLRFLPRQHAFFRRNIIFNLPTFSSSPTPDPIFGLVPLGSERPFRVHGMFYRNSTLGQAILGQPAGVSAGTAEGAKSEHVRNTGRRICPLNAAVCSEDSPTRIGRDHRSGLRGVRHGRPQSGKIAPGEEGAAAFAGSFLTRRWRKQSRANPSLKPNSLLAGKIQGILLSRPPAAG
jgi:hypothetical protein